MWPRVFSDAVNSSTLIYSCVGHTQELPLKGTPNPGDFNDMSLSMYSCPIIIIKRVAFDHGWAHKHLSRLSIVVQKSRKSKLCEDSGNDWAGVAPTLAIYCQLAERWWKQLLILGHVNIFWSARLEPEELDAFRGQVPDSAWAVKWQEAGQLLLRKPSSTSTRCKWALLPIHTQLSQQLAPVIASWPWLW